MSPQGGEPLLLGQGELCLDTTVFVTTVGDEPNFSQCLEHLAAQTVRCRVEIIDHVAPMSAAFQQMHDRCRTTYYVQVDEDMLLYPHGIANLRERIQKSPPHIALVCAPLWDCDIERPIEGVKIYRHEIVRRFPYEDSVSCEVSQLDRMWAAGYDLERAPLTDRSLCLGDHGKNYHPHSIFYRWQRLFLKQREQGRLAWIRTWPQRLLERYMETRDPLHLYAFLGAVAGITGEAASNQEKDWRDINYPFERIKRVFPVPPPPPAPPVKASIVIPLFVADDGDLERSVQSVLEQTVPCEVLVVASPSTPARNLETLAHLEQFHGNLRVQIRDVECSLPAAINYGIRGATTGLIGIVHPGEWLEADCVEKCLAHSAQVVSTGYRSLRVNGQVGDEVARRIPSTEEFRGLKSPAQKASYLSRFLLFQREALNRVGCFDEWISGEAEVLESSLIRKILEQDAKVVVIEECLLNRRETASH